MHGRQESFAASRRQTRSLGFTLIELLVVLTILGLLAGLVGPRIMRSLDDAKTKAARLQIEDFGSALEMYKLEVGSYPSGEHGLQNLVTAPNNAPGWNGPYLEKKEVPKDPWNQDYHYRYPGEHGDFDIYSLGADNAEGGEGENADVGSWQ